MSEIVVVAGVRDAVESVETVWPRPATARTRNIERIRRRRGREGIVAREVIRETG